MKNTDLYVVESWGGGWMTLHSEWRYCTGVRPSADVQAVRARLVKYQAGHTGQYRVAVYRRDVGRTDAMEAAANSATRSSVRKPELGRGAVRKRKGGAA